MIDLLTILYIDACTLYISWKLFKKMYDITFGTTSNIEMVKMVKLEPVGKAVLTNNNTSEKSEKELFYEQEQLIELFVEENKQKDEIIQQVFLNLIDIKGMMDNKAYTIHERNEMTIKSVGQTLDELDNYIENL